MWYANQYFPMICTVLWQPRSSNSWYGLFSICLPGFSPWWWHWHRASLIQLPQLYRYPKNHLLSKKIWILIVYHQNYRYQRNQCTSCLNVYNRNKRHISLTLTLTKTCEPVNEITFGLKYLLKEYPASANKAITTTGMIMLVNLEATLWIKSSSSVP